MTADDCRSLKPVQNLHSEIGKMRVPTYSEHCTVLGISQVPSVFNVQRQCIKESLYEYEVYIYIYRSKRPRMDTPFGQSTRLV